MFKKVKFKIVKLLQGYTGTLLLTRAIERSSLANVITGAMLLPKALCKIQTDADN